MAASCGCGDNQGPRRIRLLDGQSAIMVALAGMVVHGEYYETAQRIETDLPLRLSRRAQSFMRASLHESIHHFQAAGGFQLQMDGGLLLAAAVRLLRADPGDRNARREYDRARRTLTARRHGMSCVDILESGANLGSFQWNEVDWGRSPGSGDALKRYEQELSGLRRTGDRRYHYAFDWLAKQIGSGRAYRLFLPISFIAFNTPDPVRTFMRYGRRLRHDRIDLLGMLEVDTVMDMIDSKHSPIRDRFWLRSADIWRSYERHPRSLSAMLTPGSFLGARMVDAFGLDMAVEIMVHPWRLVRDDLPNELEDAFSPIITVYSSAVGLVEFRHSIGWCADTPIPHIVRKAVLDATIAGAAERLRQVADGNRDVYRHCPHSGCPHYAAGLCHQYFVPPPLDRHHDECLFPELMQKSLKMNLADVYERWKL